MGKITDQQNIFDATLQAYGTLDQVVNFAFDNDFLLDELPIVGSEWIKQPDREDQQVIEFIIDRQWTYNNAGIEASAALLANDQLEVLIAEAGVKILYR